MKPTTKQKLIKAIDIAVQALELKCGGPGSGVPGPCPLGNSGGGGAKPSAAKPARNPDGTIGKYSKEESHEAAKKTVEKHLKGKGFKEENSQWGPELHSSKATIKETSAAFKKDGWIVRPAAGKFKGTTLHATRGFKSVVMTNHGDPVGVSIGVMKPPKSKI